MESATMWLGISGLLLIALAMRQRVRGAMLVGILWVTFISWIPGSAVSFLGSGASIPGGLFPQIEHFLEVLLALAFDVWQKACALQTDPMYLAWSVVGGADRMHYFKNVVAAPDASFTAGKLDFGGLKHGQAWLALVRSFHFVEHTCLWVHDTNCLSAAS